MSAFEQPDLELLLRGRPTEFPATKFQLIAPHRVNSRRGWISRVLQAAKARKVTLLTFAILGAAAGYGVRWFSPASYEALARVEAPDSAAYSTYLKDPAVIRDAARAAGGERFAEDWMNRVDVRSEPPASAIQIVFGSRNATQAKALVAGLIQAADDRARKAKSAEFLAVQARFSSEIEQTKKELVVVEDDLLDMLRSKGSATATQADQIADALQLAKKRKGDDREVAQRRSVAAKQNDVEAKRSHLEGLVQRSLAATAELDRATIARVIAPPEAVALPPEWSARDASLAGLGCGLLFGFPYCIVRETRRRKIKRPGDIAARVGIRELGSIPTARTPMAPSGQRSGKPTDSFRSVLSSVWVAGQTGKRFRVITVASPAPKDGRTTVAANLATALAHTNRRVLLLEADLRNPRAHEVLGAARGWGLANLLDETRAIEDYSFGELAVKTNVPGLYVLPAGKGPAHMSVQAYAERLEELLMRLRLEFHSVFIDTPEALKYPDARVVAHLSDGVLMVVRSEVTRESEAAALLRRFEQDGTVVLGAILNDTRTRSR